MTDTKCKKLEITVALALIVRFQKLKNSLKADDFYFSKNIKLIINTELQKKMYRDWCYILANC